MKRNNYNESDDKLKCHSLKSCSTTECVLSPERSGKIGFIVNSFSFICILYTLYDLHTIMTKLHSQVYSQNKTFI